MKLQSITGACGLVGLLLLISPSFAMEDKAFTESVVIFNTICENAMKHNVVAG